MFTTIEAYHKQLLSGSTTCFDTVKHFLEKINEHKHLNAFIEVFGEEALERAIALDSIRQAEGITGKLHGVVVAIKDVLCYEAHKVSAASKILEGFTSVYNATAIQRLLDEQAIIIGRCNCDEFAMGSTNENSSFGNVLNAADNSKVPGGSSGGSAVAVQAGMSMISLGSDTGGSVRQPADFCGIIGFKPTYGRISRYGLIAYASSFDQIGIFGHTVEDVALALEVMAGSDEFDSTALDVPANSWQRAQTNEQISAAGALAEKQFRIAYFKEAIDHPFMDGEIGSAIEDCLSKLEQDGHVVHAVDFNLLDHVVPTYYVLTTAEASSNLSRYDGVRYGHRTSMPVTDLTEFYMLNRSEGFGKEVQRRILLGTFVLSAGYYDAYFSKAQQVRKLLIDKTESIFSNYDAIILPTSPTTAFPIGEKTGDPVAMYLADIYTVFANLTGVPGIALPLFKHSNGMPFGLQVLTNKEDELTLFQLSNLLMARYKAVAN